MAAASFARISHADGAVVCERCEVRKSSFGRIRGLLGRSGLDPGSGMLIDSAPSVHMFWSVVGVRHGLRPWRVAGARRAVAALELPAGAAAASGIREGDVLVLDELEAGGLADPPAG